MAQLAPKHRPILMICNVGKVLAKLCILILEYAQNLFFCRWLAASMVSFETQAKHLDSELPVS